ncbi:hypothetical protein F4818DRAFT_129880 [Hypoxylon cercidicola]|nr:hypothetical protein F4818DRAFT_129880 [Hypoxylon cercidicola]
MGTPKGAKLRALRILTVLALRLDPGLLTQPKVGDTALHKALSLKKDEVKPLAWILRNTYLSVLSIPRRLLCYPEVVIRHCMTSVEASVWQKKDSFGEGPSQ